MANITNKHRILIDRKTKRIQQREAQKLVTRRRTGTDISRGEFHHILDKASQPTKAPESDSETS